MSKTASSPGSPAGPAAKTIASISRSLAEKARAELPGTAQSEVFTALLKPYLAKVAAEREARLAGRVVDADFALRQATVYEIALDLAARSNGEIGMEALRSACQSGELTLADIAQSPLSKLLGDARRALWTELAAPARPEGVDAELLDHSGGGGLTTEPAKLLTGGKDLLTQQLAQQQRHEDAAKAQVAWEAAKLTG
jgi:hypothetical protein